jgi:AcrR family transcriptional regulator
MAKDTRARMIDAAVEALRHEGLAGMSFTDVLARSGAARGAIYHHFPGGKNQLAAEAAQLNGEDVLRRLAGLKATSPHGVVEAFVRLVRPVVEEAARGSGCAVAAVTQPANETTEQLCGIAATTFAAWATHLADSLTAAGMARGKATDLGHLLIDLLEGAQIVCRASGSTEPFDHAARAAIALAR